MSQLAQHARSPRGGPSHLQPLADIRSHLAARCVAIRSLPRLAPPPAAGQQGTLASLRPVGGLPVGGLPQLREQGAPPQQQAIRSGDPAPCMPTPPQQQAAAQKAAAQAKPPAQEPAQAQQQRSEPQTHTTQQAAVPPAQLPRVLSGNCDKWADILHTLIPRLRRDPVAARRFKRLLDPPADAAAGPTAPASTGTAAAGGAAGLTHRASSGAKHLRAALEAMEVA